MPWRRGPEGLVPIGWAIGGMLSLAFVVAAVVIAILFVVGQFQGFRKEPLTAAALYDLLKIGFAFAAGVGGVVALVTAYRRQRVQEFTHALAARAEERAGQTEARETTRVLNERFATAAGQLGDDRPAVRLAGVYAMAGLADDWTHQRQVCVNVLCAFLRMPYEPDPGDEGPTADRLEFKAGQEVRHTVIRAIADHLQPDNCRAENAQDWRGLNLDFTGTTFDGGSFAGAAFSRGTVKFTGARFSGRQVDFTGAEFSGGTVDFTAAEFTSGTVNFTAAKFSGGTVNFTAAKFSGGTVNFTAAKFPGGTVNFTKAEFSNGTVNFTAASFHEVQGREIDWRRSKVNFDRARFSGSKVNFSNAEFSRKLVDFRGTTFSGGTVDFGDAEFARGTVNFDDFELACEIVNFDRTKFAPNAEYPSFFDPYPYSRDPDRGQRRRAPFLSSGDFDDPYPDGPLQPNGGWIDFRLATFSSGTVNFDEVKFFGDMLDFRTARFSGGTVDFRTSRFPGPKTEQGIREKGGESPYENLGREAYHRGKKSMPLSRGDLPPGVLFPGFG